MEKNMRFIRELNFDSICKVLVTVIIGITSIAIAKAMMDMEFIIPTIIFCAVFLPTRKFEKTIRKYDNFLMMVEYWHATWTIILIVYWFSANQMVGSIIFLIALVLSLCVSYYYHTHDQSTRRTMYANEDIKHQWFRYTIGIVLLSMIFFFINLAWFGTFALSLLCAQYYLYMSYHQRTVLLKR